MTASNPDSLLASGGGNATSSGVLFESGVASYFGAAMLAEKNIDRFPDMTPAVPVVVRMETEAPVDDILVETSAGGFIFVQVKTRVDFAAASGSPFAKTIEQFVRHWLVCASGSGERHWNRPLDQARDRLVLAVGPASSNGIKTDLRLALEAKRAQASAPLPQGQQVAFDRLTKTIEEVWRASCSTPVTDDNVAALTRLVDVLVFDFEGPDQSVMRSEVRYRSTVRSPTPMRLAIVLALGKGKRSGAYQDVQRHIEFFARQPEFALVEQQHIGQRLVSGRSDDAESGRDPASFEVELIWELWGGPFLPWKVSDMLHGRRKMLSSAQWTITNMLFA